MADISTKYMGIELNNPLIVASSGLTKSLEKIKKLAENGAAAIVLKSLFEEQVQREVGEELEQHIAPSWHTEAYDYVSRMGMEFGPAENLKLIEQAKKAVSIPIIASLNCVSPYWWKDYARQIELAGADAIELNIAYAVTDVRRESREVEQLYFRILDKVRGAVNIPVAVKLGPYFTSFSNLAYELCRRGASALVLFNRFYQFDIDPEAVKVKAGNPLSEPAEISLSLHWIAILAGRVSCDLSATTGIHSAADVIKQILAGATTVQLCSVLYKKGTEQITHLLKGIEDWMNKQGVSNLNEIRGKLSMKESEKPELYERLQYIKALVGIE